MPARFAEEVTTDSRVNVSPSAMDLGSGHYNNNNIGTTTNGTHNFRRFSPITDEVCITGVSGRFPESSNIAEFRKNLFDGVDMVNDEPRRWDKGIYDLPERMGKIKDEDLANFDEQFFGVHHKQADYMDPQVRMLLEVCYEAIFDSGVNPQELRGTRTGVYIGASNSETEQYFCANPDRVNGYGLVGCCRAMFGNRVSFCFDLKGPSFAIDTACSSSILALDRAFADIKSGVTDAALVAGCNVNFKPMNSLQFKRLNMLSSHGTCKAFDVDGSGYVRSEAVGAIFLQKSKDARRIYSTILNVRTNTDGYKEEGITYPDGKMQNQLIRETCEEIGLNPQDVSYIEAHGTGTKVGDPQEVNSIADFFCKDRTTPLLIGSVKSNMGHSEPASGICSIAKILIAMEAGVIPANLHYKTPNPNLYGIMEGKLKVVDKNMPWNGGIVAMNSFGFGGANGHVILKSNPKPKMVSPKEGPAKLVICSGRTSDAVQKLLDEANENKYDEEYIGMLNEIHKINIPQHKVRGYAVLNDKGTGMREVLDGVSDKRPVWFVYTGMGSQWAHMANDLMKFDVFRESIYRLAEVLRPMNVELIDILTKHDDKAFDIVLNSFVSIAAMQIALTDLLTSLNICPDGIIGHSVGELGCAYADGCFTPEQTILAAYWRGKSIEDTKLIKGGMAAVGMTWEDLKKTLPPSVIPVCHNSVDSVTISGPEEDTLKVVEKLNADGIFAKSVKSSGYAFHSQYIADAGPKLRKSLDKIIPTPKNRSSRWISTSIPESAWNTPIAKQSSAAYHVNNLLSPVLFYEGLQHIPENAICIEIAPHGLLQAILKRALGPNVSNISLVKRGHENNHEFLLSSIGKFYAVGGQPQVTKLFRAVNFPVGRGTPMLNSAVVWDHSQKWFVASFRSEKSGGETAVEINLENEDYSFISGHTIDGRILFPATGYMTLAWNTYSKLRGSELVRTPVVFENLVFHRATIINKSQPIKFGINFLDGTGNFEICESGSLTVSGKITVPENIEVEELPLAPLEADKSFMSLSTNDVYKELRLRGYDYGGLFQGVAKSDLNARVGELKWDHNWISFMDTMLQFAIIGKDLRELYLPTRIEKAVLNPMKHLKVIEESLSENKTLPVYMYKDINVIKSGGIEMRGLKATMAPRRSGTQNAPTLEKYIFVPQQNVAELNENSEKARHLAVSTAVRMVMENSENALKIKVVELEHGRVVENLLSQTVLATIEGEPLLAADVAVATINQVEQYTNMLGDSGIRVINKNIAESPVEQNCHLILGADILSRADNKVVIENMIASVKINGFLLFEENSATYQKVGKEFLGKFRLTVIQEQKCGQKIFILTRPICDIESRKKSVIYLTENNFKWLDNLKTALASAEAESKYLYLVSQGEELFGAQGLMNCIKNEAGGKYARLYFIQDNKVENFSFDSVFYRNQLEKDLVSNVFKNGAWGTFKHIKIESQSELPTLQVEHAYVNALVKGDLSSLKWIEGPLARQQTNSKSSNDLEMCTVYYAPINFRDVMLSSGKLSADALPGDLAQQDCVLGLEFAGRDKSGNRIMAMVPAKSLATTCLASKRMMWKVPENWSMEEASTVPCVYSTVYYALVVRGQMKRGEKILIHAGSGGVGQAAISVALHHGLSVFTTVGSKEKRDFLLKRFPKLNERYIGNSRDSSFEQMVMRETQGRGVDLVLNSLSEEKLQASVRCLGLNGRFLEIGKFDLSNNNPLGMSVFLKNTSFHGILLDSVMEGEEEMQNQVVNLVADGIKNGAVQPLPTSVFNEHQIEQAFRYMASGKHIGKVVIKVRDDEQEKVIKPALKLVNALPRTYMHPEKSYIVVGGLGGFGLELTNWLIARGARNVVLTSRSGVKTGYQTLMIQRWRGKGVKVLIDTNDATTKDGCQKLLENSNRLGLIGGIFNLAAVLRDDIIENLTEKDFAAVCMPKVNGTKYLDILSRTMCPELDYFICFSSVSCGRGNIGQTNYGLANSAMERICENRQASGFPGMAIQWGAIGDTGLVIENLGDNETVIGGTLPQRMSSCLQTMDIFLQQPHAVLASMVVAEKRKSDSSSGVSLFACVANILGLRDVKNLQDTVTLSDLGMDSLMGAEIKQTLERNFDIIMSPQEIRSLTVAQLKTLDAGGAQESVPDTVSNKTTTTSANTLTFDKNQVVFCADLIPKEPIVCLNDSTKSNKNPIFMIHAIEGFADPFKKLAKRLNVKVYGLQCTEDAPLTSIVDLAKYHLKQIKKVQPKGPYSIVGYSYGALLSSEIVSQLENEGETVKLVLLDGSPKYVTIFTRTQLSVKAGQEDPSPDMKHSLGLAYFGFVLGNLDYGEVIKVLLKEPTWDHKIKKVVDLISANIDKSPELITKTAISFYKKLEIAVAYSSDIHLKCNVTLIKPTDISVNLGEDYDLSEICSGSVKVVQVEGNHRTFLEIEESVKSIQSLIEENLV
ncbi:fatty acid synthase [Condylostylus longicornis]|uniref:fatty acid synthase n=1 Tax=Condylostylus longicornis TaxID=2530218 RepID=UPI00244DE9C3|nr:fatty acid synthase [Condylostylus longicornis]